MTTAVRQRINNNAAVTDAENRLIGGQDSNSLLLEREQQLQELEEARKKLEADRDTLQRQCQILAEKIKLLESEAANSAKITQSNQCEFGQGRLSDGQTLSIDDLPMIDPAEFLPIVDQPEKETAVQRLFRLVRP